MITQLDLLHFKCFGLLKLPLGSLTLLSGANASGKSTVLQSLVLLQQTMQTDEWSTRLLLNGSMVNFGTVADTLHQQARGHFAIGVVGDSSNCLWIFSGEREEMSFAVESIRFGTSGVEKPSSLQYLLPPNSDPATFSLVDRIRSLSYISAEREGPRELYPLQDSHRRPTVGPTGENAISVLLRAQDKRVASPLRLSGATTPLLRAQVEARLEAFFPGGVVLNVTPVPNVNAVTLGIRTSSETEYLRPVHVGFGITQVLPIIIAILSSPKGTVHLIENPEVHLHPAGQALMGQFLADAACAGHQLIVETHSDHVLNGIRRSVKDGKLESDQVAIHFFRSPFAEHSQVLSVALDDAGNLDAWPEGFFDQFDKDANYFAGWAK